MLYLPIAVSINSRTAAKFKKNFVEIIDTLTFNFADDGRGSHVFLDSSFADFF